MMKNDTYDTCDGKNTLHHKQATRQLSTLEHPRAPLSKLSFTHEIHVSKCGKGSSLHAGGQAHQRTLLKLNFFTEHLLTIHTLSPQSIESILLNPWMKRMDGRKRMKGQCNVIETFQNKYTNYLKLSLLLRYLRYLFSWPTCTSSLRLFSLVPSSLSDLFCEHFLLCSASSWMYRGVM